MSVKFELFVVWVLSIVGYLAKHDVLFFVSITVQIVIGIKNLPGAAAVILKYLYRIKDKLNQK